MAGIRTHGFYLNHRAGFTVIELMLFLGVSGALFAALITGVNTNIIQQRYRESVLNFSTMLQNQYSEVSNTRNERNDNLKCIDGTVTNQPTSGDARGTSPCVLLGRAIEVNGNGTIVRSMSVIGDESEQTAAAGDLEALKAYRPKQSSFGEQTTELDWQASLKTAEGQPSMASIVILRSPASGLLRVFTSQDQLPSDLSEMITAEAASSVLTLCVSGDSGLLPLQAVSIDPRIAGPDGVTVKEIDSGCES